MVVFVKNKSQIVWSLDLVRQINVRSQDQVLIVDFPKGQSLCTECETNICK